MHGEKMDLVDNEIEAEVRGTTNQCNIRREPGRIADRVSPNVPSPGKVSHDLNPPTPMEAFSKLIDSDSCGIIRHHSLTGVRQFQRPSGRLECTIETRDVGNSLGLPYSHNEHHLVELGYAGLGVSVVGVEFCPALFDNGTPG